MVHPRKWIFLHCFDIKTLKFSPLTKKNCDFEGGSTEKKKESQTRGGNGLTKTESMN